MRKAVKDASRIQNNEDSMFDIDQPIAVTRAQTKSGEGPSVLTPTTEGHVEVSGYKILAEE